MRFKKKNVTAGIWNIYYKIYHTVSWSEMIILFLCHQIPGCWVTHTCHQSGIMADFYDIKTVFSDIAENMFLFLSGLESLARTFDEKILG